MAPRNSPATAAAGKCTHRYQHPLNKAPVVGTILAILIAVASLYRRIALSHTHCICGDSPSQLFQNSHSKGYLSCCDYRHGSYLQLIHRTDKQDYLRDIHGVVRFQHSSFQTTTVVEVAVVIPVHLLAAAVAAG